MQLVPFVAEFISDLHIANLNDSSHMRYSINQNHFWDAPSASFWLRKQRASGARVYAILIDGNPVGTITLRPKRGLIDVSFLIYREFSGRGIATKAVQQVSRLAEMAPAVRFMSLGCDSRNEAVIRIALGLGYELWKVQKGELSPATKIHIYRLRPSANRKS